MQPPREQPTNSEAAVGREKDQPGLRRWPATDGNDVYRRVKKDREAAHHETECSKAREQDSAVPEDRHRNNGLFGVP